MSVCSLQSGGTFKNVLARRLDEVIIPILAEIIAFLDHNCNLSLLQEKADATPLFELWLKIFQSSLTEERLRYEQMVGTRNVVMAREEFECQFPFFWLVKETIDTLWETAKGIAGISASNIHTIFLFYVILMYISKYSHDFALFNRY